MGLALSECIVEVSDSAKLAAIYGAITENFDVSAEILGDQCIEEVDDSIKLAAIYQALSQIGGGPPVVSAFGHTYAVVAGGNADNPQIGLEQLT